MTWEEQHKEFLRMEDELRLFETKVNGVLLWERMRFQVYSAIRLGNLDNGNARHRVLARSSKLRRLLKSVFELGMNPFLAPESRILFVCSARRILERDGLWWDIYTDPIIQSFRSKPLSVETHFENMHYKPAKTPLLRHLDIIESITYIKRTLGITRISLTKNDVSLLRKVRKEILSRFGVDFDIESHTLRILEERKARIPLYRRLLKKIQPKVVVLAQGYLWEDMIEACKELGIKTVELQHGLIYPMHVAYSFQGDSKKKETFADYLLVWGNYWKSSVEYPIPIDRVVNVGFPYIESKKDSHTNVGRKRQALFISQGDIGDVLSKFAVALSNSPDLDFDILYKFHPLEQSGWKERYPWLAASRVHIVDTEEVTLHELFIECMVQVGVCSTALVEGLAFGLPTYILEAKCAELMQPYIDRGVMKKIASPDELIEDIRNGTGIMQFDADEFFKANAVENIVSFLNSLCR